jgi:CBS domain containing-hemolysin-like protein
MIETGIIVLCLLVNALLAGAEMAFVAASKPSLRELVRQGNKRPSYFSGYENIRKERYPSFKSALG